MTLRGSRKEWEAMIRRNDEGVGLKDAHLACIQHALDQAPPDALMVDVDAMLPALQQVKGLQIEMGNRSVSALIADGDERWWLRWAGQLGLSSIHAVEPWPRRPDLVWVPPDDGER